MIHPVNLATIVAWSKRPDRSERMFVPRKRGKQFAAACVRSFALAAVFWLAPGCRDPAAAEDHLKIGGTGSALGVVRLLAQQFMAQHAQVEVTLVPNLGSAGGIRALAGSAINLALTSRAMTASERKLGFAEIEFARTPFVFAVSADSKVGAISLGDVADIYAGKMTQWPDGTPVRVVLRPGSDFDTEAVKNLSPAIRLALALAEKRRGVRFSVTDQDAADDLEKIRGAIGPTALALIMSERRQLKALKLGGKDPTLANATSGAYPYYRSLFFVAAVDRPATVEGFIVFVQSPAGRNILADNGCWVARDRH